MPSCASMESRKQQVCSGRFSWTCRHELAVREGRRGAARGVQPPWQQLGSCWHAARYPPAQPTEWYMSVVAAQPRSKIFLQAKEGKPTSVNTCRHGGCRPGVCSACEPSCAAQVSRFHPGPSRLTLPQLALGSKHQPPSTHPANTPRITASQRSRCRQGDEGWGCGGV